MLEDCLISCSGICCCWGGGFWAVVLGLGFGLAAAFCCLGAALAGACA